MYEGFILTIEEMNKNLIAQNMNMHLNTNKFETYINDWVLKNKIVIIVISIIKYNKTKHWKSTLYIIVHTIK